MPKSYFDTNTPATMQDLSRIYTGDPYQTPSQVQSDLQMNAPQAADWVHQAEQKYGINDASVYFSPQQISQRTAAVQPMQQPSVNNDMAQLVAQRQQNLNRFVLPPTGISRQSQMTPDEQMLDAQRTQQQPQFDPTASLTPFQRQQGGTGYSQLLAARVGSNDRYFTDAQGRRRDWINPTSQSAYNPADLYQRPEFQTFRQQKPDVAEHVFTALTGHSLKDYEGVRAAVQTQQISREKQYEKTFYDKVVKGDLRMTPEGDWEHQNFTYDQLNKKNVPSGTWSKVSGPMAEITGIGQRAFPELQRKAQLEAKARAEAAKQAQIDAENATKSADSNRMIDSAISQAGASNLFGPFADQGGMQQPSELNPIEHQRQALMNNPQFKTLYQQNPQLAMQRLVALQYAKSRAAVAPQEADSYPLAY